MINRRLNLLLTVLLGFAPLLRADAIERGRNLVTNPGFEQESGWQVMGDGFQIDKQVFHSGHRSLRCRGTSVESVTGARQVITLDPPVRHPFRVSGWSRSENAEVGQDYDIYLDLHYADDTPLWGQIARFQPNTHGWQRAELTFDVAKPVRTIEVHLLFRKAKGTVWFDDINVELAPFEWSKVQILPGLFGPASLAVYGNTTIPASWSAALEGKDGAILQEKGPRTPIRFTTTDLSAPPRRRLKSEEYRLRLSATDDLLGETITTEHPVSLESSSRGRDYAVWTESSMRRVMPQALPEVVQSQPRARIALAGHEHESFQVVLLSAPKHELRDVQVELSDLICEARHSRISKRNIEWQQVGYVRIDKPYRHPAVTDAAPGWWPDPLLTVQSFNLPAGFAQPIWVTVYAPPHTPAGEYSGCVTIRPRGKQSARVELRATVYGFTLPVEGHLKTAFALMDGFLECVYGKPLSATLRRRYGDFLLKHRLNPDDISRTSPPAVDDLLHYRDHGLNAFNVLNLVEERGNNAWVCWSPLEVYTPKFKQHLIERLDPYVQQLRQHGLTDKAYIYTFDERGNDFYPTIREYFRMVKLRYPEIHTLTTAQVAQDPKVMRDLNVDWNCPLTPAYNYVNAEKCRAAGLQVWAYICLGPRYPYANWLADDPLIEARLIWWQVFHQKMDGFLYWGLNIWDRPHNDRLIDPQRGPLLDWSITTGGDYDWLHGDGRLLYAGKDGPIGSIRLENIRDGLEDYEYLYLLSQKSRDKEVARKACLPVTTSLTSFTRDPEVLYSQRDLIARRIQVAR